MEAGEPAGNVAAIDFVVSAEDFAEVRLFVEAHKEGHGEDGAARHDEGVRIGTAEDDPQADPTSEKAHIHRIADVAVKAHNDKALRSSDGSGRAAAGRAEIPDAAKGNCETEDGRNGGQPAPPRGVEGFGAETEPVGKQPEPESEEGGADGERGGRGYPLGEGNWRLGSFGVV